MTWLYAWAIYLYNRIRARLAANVEYAKAVPYLRAIRASVRTQSKPQRQKMFNQAMAEISDESFPLLAERFLKFLDLKSERYKATEKEVDEIFIKFPRFRRVPYIVISHVAKDRKKLGLTE